MYFSEETTTIEQTTTNVPETTTTEAPCTIEKQLNQNTCVFIEDVSKKYALFERCVEYRSQGRVRAFDSKTKTVLIDDRKCGVTNDSDVENANLCFSAMDSEHKSIFLV